VQQRREQLVRILERRRRRLRLMLVCLVTALACGGVVGVVGPQLLIGGMPAAIGGNVATVLGDRSLSAQAGPQPLDLSERLAIDPRETRANTGQWARMSEAERRVLLDKYWHMAEMSQADQDRVFQRYALLRELPDARQDSLRARAGKVAEFMKTLSPQDQAVLESMSDADRARRLLELWQARYGAW